MSAHIQRLRELISTKFNRRASHKFREFVELIKSNQIPSEQAFTFEEIATYCVKDVDKTRKTVIHIAAEGSDEVLEHLLNYVDSADLFTNDSITPLMIAVGLLDLNKIKMLTDRGANPNCVDSSGASPVETVIISDATDILQHLLDAGLDPNLYASESSQNTLLHVACAVGNLKQARLLIERGASFQYQNADGQAPIHVAAMNDHDQLVELLIAAGDDKNHPDYEGMTPLNYAKEHKATNVEKLLLDKNASMRNDLWTDREPMDAFDEVG